MGKKIAVIGVGAIGGSIGGFLTQAGEDVTLIDPWRENVDKLNTEGILLDGSVGEHRVGVTAIHTDELPNVDEKFDILVVSVKSYDTEWATKLMLPFIHEDSWVVSPQNSINEYQIAPIVGAHRMLGCITVISAGMMEAAHVTRTQGTGRAASQLGTPTYFKIGELDGSITPRAQELAEIFEAAGHTEVTDNLWGERWSKLATNCMVNPTAAMTGLNGYELRANEQARKIIFKLGLESVKVGRMLGHNVDVPVGSFSLEELEQAATSEGHEELEKVYVGERPTIPGMPSMAQDVIKWRKTEIEHLNGMVVEYGKKIGFPTPYCDAAVAVINGVESGEFEVSLENLNRLESIARANSTQ